MKRETLLKIASAITLTTAVALSSLTTGCEVTAEPVVGGVYAGDYPPDAYIATATPFYYEGHASYYYNNHWYYRDGGGRWGHYNSEPAALREHRGQAQPARRNYARAAPARGHR